MTVRLGWTVGAIILALCCSVGAADATTRWCAADVVFVDGRLEKQGEAVYARAPIMDFQGREASASRVISGLAHDDACWAAAEAVFDQVYRDTAYLTFIDRLCTAAAPHPDHGDAVPTGEGIVARATTLHVQTSENDGIDFYGGLPGVPVNCDERRTADLTEAEEDLFGRSIIGDVRQVCQRFRLPATRLWDALGYIGCPRSRPPNGPSELEMVRDEADAQAALAMINGRAAGAFWEDWCVENDAVGSQRIFSEMIESAGRCLLRQHRTLVDVFNQPDQANGLCFGLANLDFASERLLFESSHNSGLVDLEPVRFENGYNHYNADGRDIKFFPAHGSIESELVSVADRNSTCLDEVNRPREINDSPIPANTGRLTTTGSCDVAVDLGCSRAAQKALQNINNTIAAIELLNLRGESELACGRTDGNCD